MNFNTEHIALAMWNVRRVASTMSKRNLNTFLQSNCNLGSWQKYLTIFFRHSWTSSKWISTPSTLPLQCEMSGEWHQQCPSALRQSQHIFAVRLQSWHKYLTLYFFNIVEQQANEFQHRAHCPCNVKCQASGINNVQAQPQHIFAVQLQSWVLTEIFDYIFST